MKLIKSLLFIAILAISIALPTNASANQPITVYVDGVQVAFQIAPLNDAGTTLVQLRPIFEKLGYNLTWINETREVEGTNGKVRIKLGIGSTSAMVNEKQTTLEKAARIVQDSTFIPLRFVSEAIGAEVTWNGDSQRIDIVTQKTAAAALPTTALEQKKTTIPSKDRYFNVTWGMSESEVRATRNDQPVIINNNQYQLVYNYTFSAGQKGKVGYIFDGTGLIEVMYLLQPTVSFKDGFGVYTGLDMDLSYSYNNGNGPDDFKWKASSASVQAYKRVYANDNIGMAEMAMKSQDLELIANFNSPESKIFLAMFNSGSHSSPNYIVGLSYTKK